MYEDEDKYEETEDLRAEDEFDEFTASDDENDDDLVETIDVEAVLNTPASKRPRE